MHRELQRNDAFHYVFEMPQAVNAPLSAFLRDALEMG